jgi:hypothetical protein
MQAESELAADAGSLQAKRRFVTQSRLSARYGRRADRKKAAGGHISKLASRIALAGTAACFLNDGPASVRQINAKPLLRRPSAFADSTAGAGVFQDR